MIRAGFAIAIAASAGVASVVGVACSSSSGTSTTPPDAGTDGAADAAIACPNDLPPTCPAPAPAYQTDVLPVLQNRCFACHSDGGIEATEINFGSYALIYKQRQSILTQVYSCAMPLADAAPLTEPERLAVLGWLVCGAPDD